MPRKREVREILAFDADENYRPHKVDACDRAVIRLVFDPAFLVADNTPVRPRRDGLDISADGALKVFKRVADSYVSRLAARILYQYAYLFPHIFLLSFDIALYPAPVSSRIKPESAELSSRPAPFTISAARRILWTSPFGSSGSQSIPDPSAISSAIRSSRTASETAPANAADSSLTCFLVKSHPSFLNCGKSPLFCLTPLLFRDIMTEKKGCKKMKLNPDLVREILLYVEENTHDFKSVSVINMSKALISEGEYTIDELLYHLMQCDLSGLFYGCRFERIPRNDERHYIDYGRAVIECLSPKGHEFIENVREKTNWEKIKSGASKVGSFAVSTLMSLAAQTIQQAISSKLGL